MNFLNALISTDTMKAPQAVMLRLLTGDRSGVNPSEIADGTGLSPSAVSMALVSLERSGLAERRFPLRDRRSVMAYLTEEGRSRAEEMLAAMVDYVDDVKKRQSRVHPKVDPT